MDRREPPGPGYRPPWRICYALQSTRTSASAGYRKQPQVAHRQYSFRPVPQELRFRRRIPAVYIAHHPENAQFSGQPRPVLSIPASQRPRMKRILVPGMDECGSPEPCRLPAGQEQHGLSRMRGVQIFHQASRRRLPVSIRAHLLGPPRPRPKVTMMPPRVGQIRDIKTNQQNHRNRNPPAPTAALQPLAINSVAAGRESTPSPQSRSARPPIQTPPPRRRAM